MGKKHKQKMTYFDLKLSISKKLCSTFPTFVFHDLKNVGLYYTYINVLKSYFILGTNNIM